MSLAHTDHPLRHWDRTCPACTLDALAIWHYEQAATYRHIAETSAADRPEPTRGLLLRTADFHRDAASLLKGLL